MKTQKKQQRRKPLGVLCLTTVGIVLGLCGSVGHAAGLLIADGGFGGVLEIEEHTVQVTINNGIAVTEVTQVFRNTEPRDVEALYTFPVPKGASVAGFSMWINGKEMIGEVVEKQRAREIYESYKRRRIDPGLLEQKDYKSFEMRIYPIGPGAKQKVRFCYYQELDYDHDWGTYVYPLATSSKPGVDARTKGTFALTLHVKSEVPIVSMDSPSHGDAFVMVKHSETYWEGSLETIGGNLSKDVVLGYHLVRPHTGIDLITSNRKGDDGYFCLTLTAGKELAGKSTGMDYVFILDISGSMGHGAKLGMSSQTIGAFISALEPKDRFEIITFNATPGALFGQLRSAEEKPKAEALGFLTSQEARGGTVLRSALQAAYGYVDPDRTLNVVILSDGMTEQGERTTLLELIRSRPENARVFCVGVGNEVNRPLLKQLAEDAGGLASFLSRGDDFERQAKAFQRKLTHPAAANVRIVFDGLDVYDGEPDKLPNLYHGAPVRLFGRYRGGGKAKVTLQAEVAGRQITRSADMTFPELDAGNPEIERMWAWHRIQRLLKDLVRSSPKEKVITEVVRLGEGYSIATEYTSFIVLENDAEYARWKIDRRNVTRMKRDRKTQRELLAQLESMRNKALSKLGPKMGQPEKSGPVLARSQGPTTPSPQVAQPSKPQTASRSRGRGFDLFPRGGGPVGPTGLVIIGVTAVIQWFRKRRGDGLES